MKLKNILFSSCLGLLATFCCISQQAEAILASVKSLGMSATAIAYPLDTLAGAYNPAGLVWVGDRVDSGTGWLRDRASTEITNNHLPVPFVSANGKFNGMRTKDFYFAEFGINKEFCCECFDWSIGFIAYNRNFQKTTYSRQQILFGDTHTGLEFINQTFAPILAVRFWDCHSLGVSFDIQVERLMVNGLQNFDNPTFSSHPGKVTNRGYSYATGFSATFGYRGQITENIAVGATYAPEAKMSKFHKYTGFLIDGRVNVPEKIGAGIAFSFCSSWTLCFDWEHVRWSGVRALHKPLAADLTVNKLGSKNGTGFGFRNVNYYRVGLQYYPCDNISLRIGFRHANSPVRGSQTAVNALTLDCVENYITCGATWFVTPCNELSFFYAYGFEHTIHGKGAIPLVPFGGGNVKLKEWKNGIGFAWGWKY